MGILDVVLGRDAQGQPSKVNMALIALLLWRWYQSRNAGAQPQPAPQGGGMKRMPRQEPRGEHHEEPQREAHRPLPEPEVIPPGPTRSGSGNDFDDLRDSVRRVPRGGNRDMEDGPDGGGPGGGGLGDILGDILGGGAGRGGGGRGQAGPGGGGLGDILGDILGGGGRGLPGARIAGQQGDPFAELLRGTDMNGLGALLAGGAGGGVLSDLLSQFEQAGKGDAAKSWVARGDNIPVTPKDIENTFGSGIIDTLASQFGMPRDELLKGLSQVMPETIDALTPDGRLPTAEEIARRA